MSTRSTYSEHSTVIYRGSEPSTVIYRGSEPSTVIYRGSEPSTVKYGGSEPSTVIYGGSEPGTVIYGGSEPSTVIYGGSDPSTVIYGGSEPRTVIYKEFDGNVSGTNHRVTYDVFTNVDKLLEEAYTIYRRYHKKLDHEYRGRVRNMIRGLKKLPHFYVERRLVYGKYSHVHDWLNSNPEVCEFTDEERCDPIKSIPAAQPRTSTSHRNTLGKRKRGMPSEDSGKDDLSGDWSGDRKRIRRD